MEFDVIQWCAAIEAWQRDLQLKMGAKGNIIIDFNFIFKLKVVAMLLVIAGVETNPGPQETAVSILL
ncbi:hypothetical protein C0J52_14344 [Blattella germanica]|nr:hypothetical protein C0J52_14344 [Blattella germanica]